MYQDAGATVLEQDYVDVTVHVQNLRIGGLYSYCLSWRYLSLVCYAAGSGKKSTVTISGTLWNLGIHSVFPSPEDSTTVDVPSAEGYSPRNFPGNHPISGAYTPPIPGKMICPT